MLDLAPLCTKKYLMSSKVWKFRIQLSDLKIKNFKFFPNIIDFKRPWDLGILLYNGLMLDLAPLCTKKYLMSSKVWKFRIQLSGFKIKNFKFFPNIIDFKRPWDLGILLYNGLMLDLAPLCTKKYLMSSKVWKFRIQLSDFKIKNFKFFPNIIDFKKPCDLGILLYNGLMLDLATLSTKKILWGTFGGERVRSPIGLN